LAGRHCASGAAAARINREVRSNDFPKSELLRIDDAVQVESGRGQPGVAQHDVNLTSVVCLVIKKMSARNVRRFNVVFALIVRVPERATPKSDIEIREERLDPGVLARPGAPQGDKVIIQGQVQRRCHPLSVLEQAHPPPITQQNVIQQAVNATKRSWTPLPVLRVI
jgi:hypothetical protein